MKQGLKMKKGLLSVLLVLTAAIFFGVGMNGSAAGAKTWTKKAVNKEIKKTNKQIKTATKTYKKVKKKFNKQTKGTKTISFGKVISTSPLIIRQNNVLYGGTNYYWINKGGKNITNLLGTAFGYVKTTSKTKNYSGITCTVAKAVKVTANPTKYKEKLDKLKAKREKLRYSLTNKPSINYYADDRVVVGGTIDLNVLCYISSKKDGYSKLKWSSSDKGVGTVNSKGIMTGKKVGKTTITAKTTISGKSCHFDVYVYDDFTVTDSKNLITGKYKYGFEEYVYLKIGLGDEDQLIAKYNHSSDVVSVSYSSSDEYCVTVSADGVIKAINEGDSIINLKTEYCEQKVWVSVTDYGELDDDFSVLDSKNQTFKDCILSLGVEEQLRVVYNQEENKKVGSPRVTYTSDDKNVVTITSDGYLKVVGYGTTIIHVNSKYYTKSIRIYVPDPNSTGEYDDD